MIYDEIINGKTIIIRSTTVDDAAFIVDIRNDEEKNRYVHPVANDIPTEIRWIEKQRKLEGDFFFTIIRKNDGNLLGNVAIYNINKNNNCGELGRWVSYGTAVENLETILLVHDFAFGILGLDYVYTKTLSCNKCVANFWQRFGGNGEEKIIDGISYYYNSISSEKFNSIKEYYNKLLVKVV